MVFVRQYNYLGVIIDSEITLQPVFNHAKKSIYVKDFALSKLGNGLTDGMLYKHVYHIAFY